MRSRFQDFTRTPEDQPRVDVIISNSRGADDEWLKQAVKSVEEQSYTNTGLWVIDNNDHALALGAAWNIGVNASKAPLVFFLREEDIITADLIDTLVTFYTHGKRVNQNLAHVTTYMTILDERNGKMGSAQLAHAGLFEKKQLIAVPFDKTISRGVDSELLHRMRSGLQQDEAFTFGVAHHHGYIWRNHSFRIDRLEVQ